ncbi:MAG: cation transporter [Burkholderiaceae bacterium]|nr:cation transporter [Burkholderiaceae bacterium]
MSDSCCPAVPPSTSPRYRRVLWIALVLNVSMFVVEIAGSHRSGSVSLLADAIDFFGDAANYGISLIVLSMALAWRARASVLKAASMAAFGIFVLGRAVWSLIADVTPQPVTMGLIALLALAVNVGVALMLYRHRAGDSNMRSVWICSRNDALGNIAVGLAALGVMGTQDGWPDLAVAGAMASLALTGAWSIGKQAQAELRAMPASSAGRGRGEA